MTWRIAVASVIGTSHLKGGLPCQDSSRATLVDAGAGSTLICAISDGAGSAAHSELGSQAAVSTATLLIENYLQTGQAISAIQRETALSWLAQIQTTISNLAVQSGLSPRDFACTLLVAIIGTEHAAFFQIGDGAMVVSEVGDDGWAYVFWPQHGEYINTTNFVTSTDASKVIEFTSVTRKVESLAVFSDGIESLVLHYASRTVHDRFFNTIVEPVKQVATEGVDGRLSESLARYLNSEKICERTDDDKSLIVATRSPIEQPPTVHDVHAS
ncbi:PP2C family serine/threonine-protein phosphatase [Tardiphaga sp. 71_E8_N1_1]|uniref:PP2C family serine/threonine-protein phosphatase n=1 Tax=Tardiphaga sp. 71_E8_N1_1 TaxID=3240784 RepID=UPI003F8BDE64